MKTLNQLRWTFLSALFVLLGSTLALGAYTSHLAYGEALARGLNDTAMHASLAENAVTQTLMGVELSIGNTLKDLKEDALSSRLQNTLNRKVLELPVLRSLSLLGTDGKILASSNPSNVGLTVATERYLPATDAPTGQLRFGSAWTGLDFDQGEPAGRLGLKGATGFIPVTRSISKGTRSLTLLAAVDIDYVTQHPLQRHDTDVSHLSVLLTDGTLLFTPEGGELLDGSPAQLIADLKPALSATGMLERELGNGHQVLTAFKTSSQFPLVVVAQHSRARVLQTWQRNSIRVAIMMGLALLLVAVIGSLLYRRQRDLMLARVASFKALALNAKVFDASIEAILICDADNRIMSVNPAFVCITGYSASEAQGHTPRLLGSGLQDRHFFETLWCQLLENDHWQGELLNRHANGSIYNARMAITVNRDDQGLIQHYIGTLVDVTAEQQTAKALREREQQYRALFDNIQHGFALHEIITDEAGQPINYRLLAANTAYAEMTGFDAHMIVGSLVTDFFPSVHQDKVDWIGVYGEVALHGIPLRIENYSQGLNKWFDVLAYRPMARQFAVLVSDITERKKSEEKLHLAASVFANSREGIMITASDGIIIDVNDAFTNITGYPRHEVVGQTPRILNSGRQSKAFYAALWRDLHTKGHWYGEVWNRRKSGDVYAEMQTISTVFDANGKAEHYVSLFSDVTASKEHEKKLQYIAHFDALTNLPNRVLLGDRLHQGMAQALRHGKKLAVAFLDLDAFKAVNDSHGHEVGDELLVALSHRMRNALREEDTLARIGGDEFVVVMGDLADTSASVPLLNRLLSAAAQPVQIDALELQLSASLGVTFFPQPEQVEADQLLRQADQAMYQAKLAGKNRYHVFDAEQDRTVRGQHESIERIRLALSANEFVLHYQPKVNMRSGKCIGVEALIRWQHPDKGLLAPGVFLPVIEDHPLAIELGEWVIEAALVQMKQWRQQAGLTLPVSVNIGARQLQQPNFTDRLVALLAAQPDISPSLLELEVLETSALQDIAGVSRVIHACRDIGVRFALDDFGTGYSSLTYLKRLPVTMLKIDQSFVRDMLDDPDDLAILQGVIGLASAFRRDVIAEGVETVAHGAMLLRLGCELAQGYGIAKPMPADHIPAWTAAWRPDAAWKNQGVINKEALPLLFASADLRAWLASVIGFLKGDHVAAPIMDEHKCQIGQWIDAEGLLRYQGHPAYTAIAAVHQEMHVQVEEVMRLHDAKRPTEDSWPALLALRDSVLEQLEVLIQESVQGR